MACTWNRAGSPLARPHIAVMAHAVTAACHMSLAHSKRPQPLRLLAGHHARRWWRGDIDSEEGMPIQLLCHAPACDLCAASPLSEATAGEALAMSNAANAWHIRQEMRDASHAYSSKLTQLIAKEYVGATEIEINGLLRRVRRPARKAARWQWLQSPAGSPPATGHGGWQQCQR
jgi:hypothetical protein